MSKLNINNSEWLELVFEGKNKSYGAYQLRQEEGRTTMKAFFGGLLFLTVISSLLVFLSSFDKKPVIIDHNDGPVTLVDLSGIVEPETKKVEPIETKKGDPIKEPESTDLIEPTIVVAQEAPDTDFTKNNDLGKTKDPNAVTEGDGGGTPDGAITAITTNTEIPTPGPEVIMTTTTVDKNPYFPGDFSKEIARKFVAPEMDEQKTLRVIVFFVVERDGSLSNIRVANDPGYGMGAEAIRVLKAIKTKWEPGMFKGQAVRTSFSLPILVKTGTQD
jgi:periplasmic protein TonB